MPTPPYRERHVVTDGRDDSEVLVTDSATRLGDDPTGRVVIAGSHGGRYCGYLAVRARLRGIVLHDAGVGKDEAGVGVLGYLDALGVPAAVVDYRSARIGDGEDVAARGRVSYVNQAAAALGCVPEQGAMECARRMLGATPGASEAPTEVEVRFVIREQRGGPTVWGCDSNSLVRPEDEGQIVVTGSHGALLATSPRWAGPKVVAALFNDAGGGPDGAGTTRLPNLDTLGIAGVTVDAFSARIGDARSTYDDGVISHVNAHAIERGAAVGMRAREWIETLLAGFPGGRRRDGGGLNG
jgi:hypothetical protein